MADSAQTVTGLLTPSGDVVEFVVEADNPEGFITPFGAVVAEVFGLVVIGPEGDLLTSGQITPTGALSTDILNDGCHPTIYNCVEPVVADMMCVDECEPPPATYTLDLAGVITMTGEIATLAPQVFLAGTINLSGSLAMDADNGVPDHCGSLTLYRTDIMQAVFNPECNLFIDLGILVFSWSDARADDAFSNDVPSIGLRTGASLLDNVLVGDLPDPARSVLIMDGVHWDFGFRGANDWLEQMRDKAAIEVFWLMKVMTAGSGLWALGETDAAWVDQYAGGGISAGFGTTVGKSVTPGMDPTDGYHVYNCASADGVWQMTIDGIVVHNTLTNTKSWPESFAGAWLGTSDPYGVGPGPTDCDVRMGPMVFYAADDFMPNDDRVKVITSLAEWAGLV